MKPDQYEALYGWAQHLVETRRHGGNCVYLTRDEIDGFRWATMQPGFGGWTKGAPRLLGYHIVEVPAEMLTTND